MIRRVAGASRTGGPRPGSVLRARRPLLATLACATTLSHLAACGEVGTDAVPRIVGVVTAMPSELGAILEHASIDEVRAIDGRWFRIGRVGETRVVVAMTGIGIENARSTARTMLSSFALSGVVVSGVSSGTRAVGDVAVPAAWEGVDGLRSECEPAWIALARREAAAGRMVLERCTEIPGTAPLPGVVPGERVCLDVAPAVVLGGVGRSGDDSSGAVAPCVAGGDDVFACDAESPPAAPPAVGPSSVAPLLAAAPGDEVASDMETAAIAAETVARGLPFVAFRASSDGPGDPLGLEGFLEFFAYYRLAARNAASAVAVFVASLAPART